MAITYAVTSLSRNVEGAKRVHRGVITMTGTYTAGGDTVTAASLGLSLIEDLVLSTLNDGAGSPLALVGVPVRTDDFNWKIAVTGNVVGAVNTATEAASKTVAMGAGQTLTGYRARFTAVGR